MWVSSCRLKASLVVARQKCNKLSFSHCTPSSSDDPPFLFFFFFFQQRQKTSFALRQTSAECWILYPLRTSFVSNSRRWICVRTDRKRHRRWSVTYYYFLKYATASNKSLSNAIWLAFSAAGGFKIIDRCAYSLLSNIKMNEWIELRYRHVVLTALLLIIADGWISKRGHVGAKWNICFLPFLKKFFISILPSTY